MRVTRYHPHRENIFIDNLSVSFIYIYIYIRTHTHTHIYIYIYNCFLSSPPPPYPPQPPAPSRQTLTRASGHVCSVLACQLQGMVQLLPCVQCTHLRYTNSLAHAWHGKTQMRELKRYIEQVPLSFTLPTLPKANPKHMDLPCVPPRPMCNTSRLRCWCVSLGIRADKDSRSPVIVAAIVASVSIT